MRKYILCFLCFLLSQAVGAQVVGQVVDADDGYAIPYASVKLVGTRTVVSCNGDGIFKIDAQKGQKLQVSSVGYQTKSVTIDALDIEIALKASTHQIGEVTVKAKHKRYRRKNNPAVELMRRVIAAKKLTDLRNHDFFEYTKYQKLTCSLSGVDSMKSSRPDWWKRHLETSDYNEKLILPLTVDETLTRHVYRKNPLKDRDITMARQSTGVNELFQTGEIVNTMLKEIFQDVNLYDDHIRLVQYPFPSPIGKTAISFYHFHIEDTVKVDTDSCYHLRFYPANQQDFGFSGDLYVLKDSSLHVKRCVLNIPHKSDVNFVKSMRIEQEYTRLPNGEWVLSRDDMWTELSVLKLLKDLMVVRKTRLDNYSFEPLPKKLFRGKVKNTEDPDARIHDKEYWAENRRVPLTTSEADMDQFVYDVQHAKGSFWLQTIAKVFLENFMETSRIGHKSKFDFGPMNTIVSHNYIDGLRLRVSGRTMAALNPHLFWKGYGAYGTDSHRWYYGSEVTYAFNKKQNSPFEFPQRNITFNSEKDVMSSADKYLFNNKDNVFESFRTQKVTKMYFYNRQELSFVYETDWGMQFKTGLKAESNSVAGTMRFQPLVGDEIFKIRTTELSASINYSPGRTYINTKQRRWPTNFDNPEFTLSHTIGLKHFLGGQYRLNITQLKLYHRQWLGSWGYVNINVNMGAQWNKVPYPLLIMPPVNLSYFIERDNETFNLMRNLEFLNDRYIFWNVSWDMNGKLLNRIPLIKHLKWREYFSVKGLYGHLTDKNNPLKNPNDPMLFEFPEEAHIMSGQPYWELEVGIHNIFKFFAVNYVRRLTYLDNPHIDKWGLRFAFVFSF
jgi:hypothetical protein